MAAGTHTFTNTTSFTFSRGDSFPSLESRRRVQVTSQSAGGQMFVQDRGLEIVLYTLVFERLTQADRDNLVTFWRTDVLGSLNTFTWNDLDDVDRTVRMMNNPLGPQEVGNDGSAALFNVTINLREEL